MSQNRSIKLSHPIHTLDNRLLVTAGAELSAENPAPVAHLKKGRPHPRAPLLNHGSVEKDIRDYLGTPPYDLIFSSPAHIATILRIMARARPISPILDSLDYFKQHDPYTYRHVLVVFSLSLFLARSMVAEGHGAKQDFVFGLTHDIGKACVPIDILVKKDPLTRYERRIMQQHAINGYVLLSYYLRDSRVASPSVARDHHERRDGSGYPFGISLSDKLVEIVAVSELYDALISTRVYRPVSFDNRTALEELTNMAERGRIGWSVVRALVAHNRKDKPNPDDVSVSLEKRGTPPPGNVYGITAGED